MDEEVKNPADMTDEEFEEYLERLAFDEEEDNPNRQIDEASHARQDADGGTPYEQGTEEREPSEQYDEPEYSDGSYEGGAAKAMQDFSAPSGGEASAGITQRLEDYARHKFPDSGNPVEELLDELEGEAASAEGVAVEDYRQNRADMREFERWKQERESRKSAEDSAQKVIDEWEADAQKLKEFVPSFDLRQALTNEQFRQRLLSGDNVIKAYRALNPPSQEQPREKVIDEVGRDASGSARGSVERDISQMSDKEFREYIKRIEEE